MCRKYSKSYLLGGKINNDDREKNHGSGYPDPVCPERFDYQTGFETLLPLSQSCLKFTPIRKSRFSHALEKKVHVHQGKISQRQIHVVDNEKA